MGVCSCAQHLEIAKQGKLPTDLTEASGLELLNDTTFVAINDGGNKSILFVLNLDGSLRKKVSVLNANNHDWEDLSSDGEFLYIADFGNNNNTRIKLVVYKVKIESILNEKTVNAYKIFFNYKEQVAFPPSGKNMEFDAEAIVCVNDSLMILTKSRSIPWTGNSHLYYLPKTAGTYEISTFQNMYIGPDGWYADAITGADYLDGKLYVTTYNRLIRFNFANNTPVFDSETKYLELTQKEAIVVKSENEIYLMDEVSSILGGGNLFKSRMK